MDRRLWDGERADEPVLLEHDRLFDSSQAIRCGRSSSHRVSLSQPGWLQEPPPSDVIYEELLFGYYLWISSYVLMGLAQVAWGWRRSA